MASASAASASAASASALVAGLGSAQAAEVSGTLEDTDEAAD